MLKKKISQKLKLKNFSKYLFVFIILSFILLFFTQQFKDELLDINSSYIFEWYAVFFLLFRNDSFYNFNYKLISFNFFTLLVFIWRFISDRNVYSGYTFDYYFLLFSKRLDGKILGDIYLNSGEVPHLLFVNLIRISMQNTVYFEVLLFLYICKSMIYSLFCVCFMKNLKFKLEPLYFYLCLHHH